MDAQLFTELLKQGPGYVFGAAMFWLFLRERGRTDTLTDKLIDLGVKSVESQTKATGALEGFGELIKSTLQLVGSQTKGG